VRYHGELECMAMGFEGLRRDFTANLTYAFWVDIDFFLDFYKLA